MVNSNLINISLALGLTMQSVHAGSWYSEPPKGWLWYKKIAKPKKVIKEEAASKPPLTAPAPEKPVTYRDRLKQSQEQFEEIQAKAVMEPTLANVQNLYRAQNVMMDQATVFEKLWMLASLLDAQGYRESDQPFPLHRKIYQEKEEKQLDRQIKQMTRQFGLFFVFKQDCPYCHEFAPIVRQFIDQYGFEYKAISPQGQRLPAFPDAVADNGTIQILNPEGIYPALFLVNPTTRDVIPLARGLVNLSELRENMKIIIDSLKGAPYGRP
ncbi:conjugal transfer protein TraF [Candidatus Odyssella thessalonicensis]|uniref:conjugal transfer protein TraF n=1 Tax=Candidatus Odyssella thessalonicensis TaxID=84647 RepID=UPI000225A9D7|nr:conjugal transfer protein TraF [Candidatus Odyssella thessalonicensis]